jgi:hypothetical protein
MCDEQFSTMEKNRAYSREFLSSWPNHVNGWTKSNTNKLVIRYEDMLHHPISQTQKILQFLSIESRYSIDEIVVATSFKELKNQEMQNGFIERKGTESFFRKGAARAWKDVKYDFSRVTSSFATTMTKFGYELNC